jgi:ring-1,2-phenylacetyl-CoA epoxidase subunit PaaD
MSVATTRDVRQQVSTLVGNLPDPEIPVLTLADLGVIRSIDIAGDTVIVGIAPTYSGCPATEVIESSVIDVLQQHGFANVATRRVLSPPWTTDWISDEGRNKLKDYGIAPPDKALESRRALFRQGLPVACPRCGAVDTTRVSEFGSTPCKSSYKCKECLEPFEYFKCL